MTGSPARLRAAALWLVHGASLARLLAAHGKDEHAANLRAALDEAARILAAETGPAAFSDAMGEAADRLWESEAPPRSRLKQ